MAIDSGFLQKTTNLDYESQKTEVATPSSNSNKKVEEVAKKSYDEKLHSSISTTGCKTYTVIGEICHNCAKNLFCVLDCKIDNSVDLLLKDAGEYTVFVKNNVVKLQKKDESRDDSNNYNIDKIIEVVNNSPLISYEFENILQELVDTNNEHNQLIMKKNLVLSNPRNEFIQRFMLNHLKPYFEREITPETEDKQRKPLIDALFNKLQAAFPQYSFDKQDVENYALKVYVAEAASEINRTGMKFNPGASFFLDCDDEDDEELVDAFCEELVRAVNIDFKDLNLSDEAIIDLGVVSLNDILKMEFKKEVMNKKRIRLKKLSKKDPVILQKEKNEQWKTEIAQIKEAEKKTIDHPT